MRGRPNCTPRVQSGRCWLWAAEHKVSIITRSPDSRVTKKMISLVAGHEPCIQSLARFSEWIVLLKPSLASDVAHVESLACMHTSMCPFSDIVCSNILSTSLKRCQPGHVCIGTGDIGCVATSTSSVSDGMENGGSGGDIPGKRRSKQSKPKGQGRHRGRRKPKTTPPT